MATRAKVIVSSKAAETAASKDHAILEDNNNSPRPSILSRKRSFGQLKISPNSPQEAHTYIKDQEIGHQHKRKCSLMMKKGGDSLEEVEIIAVDEIKPAAVSGQKGSKVLTVINDGGRTQKGVERSHRNSECSSDLKDSEVDSGVFDSSTYDCSGNASSVFSVHRTRYSARGRFSRCSSVTSLDAASSSKRYTNMIAPKLPRINFADTREVWELMLKKDEKYLRNALYMNHHDIKSGMRAILLDWLNEVSEVYHLHRETYYLAIDYIDRFLSVSHRLPKSQLQLLGITCLFIAAKMEEIYPPKMEEFVYVTDNACTLEEVTMYELIVLKALKWELTPVTINHWLGMFVKLYFSINPEENDENCDYSPTTRSQKALRSTVDEFLLPPRPSKFFAKIAHFLDLIVLDVGMLNFSYAQIAASALYHFTNENVVYACTGMKVDDLKDCIFWMTPFALAIRDDNFNGLKFPASPMKKSPSPKKLLMDASADVSNSSSTPPSSQIKYKHNMQYHTVDLALLEKAHKTQSNFYAQMNACPSASPDNGSPIANSPSKSTASDPAGYNANRVDSSILSSPVFKSNFMATPPNSATKMGIAHPLIRSRSD